MEEWQLGMKIVVDIYMTTKNYPKEELCGLVNQMRKAAVSVPSNIAEGFGRVSNREYKHFLQISLGSCGELETQVEASLALKYINESERNGLLELLGQESRMLRDLIKKL